MGCAHCGPPTSLIRFDAVHRPPRHRRSTEDSGLPQHQPSEVQIVHLHVMEQLRPLHLGARNWLAVDAGLCQDAEALQWLERACSVRDVHLIFLTADCKWSRFRGDSGFQALLSRGGPGRCSRTP